jgi:hypothetical protein
MKMTLLAGFAVVGLAVVASGQSRAARQSASPGASLAGVPAIAFLARTYRLGSYNEKKNPMWEFIMPDENINDWQTLLTVIERTDAHSAVELDRLAEGIMSTYKSNGGQILLARTLRDHSGAAFNYMVAAFEEPGKHRYELNFVKVAMGPKNAAVIVYGIRISDPQDYRAKAKQFLDQSSGEVGQALGQMALPDVGGLPRKVF